MTFGNKRIVFFAKLSSIWKYSRTALLLISIVGLSGLGIFLYADYAAKKTIETEKTQILLEEQQKRLEEAEMKLDDLKQQAETQTDNLKKRVEDLTESQNRLLQESKQSTPKEIIISSADIAQYLTGVVQVYCNLYNGGSSSGSGSLWTVSNIGYSVLTNKHVVTGSKNCIIMSDEVLVKDLSIERLYNWNDASDIAILKIGALKPNDIVPPSNFNYKISQLRKCDVKMPVGSPVVVIGFPISGKQGVTVYGYSASDWSRITTNGIISAYDDTSVYPIGSLPYFNYFVSAKMDAGNSGGGVISKDQSGLCLLGIPTWLSIGKYENQGIVQNIHNVIYK